MLGAKAALPPPPLRRGTLAVALPVPRDSAVVRFPAMGSLPCGCSLLDWMASTARFITSGLSGVENMLGSVVFPVDSPCKLKIFAVFCFGMAFQPYFPWGDSSDIYVTCGAASGISLGGRAGTRKRIWRFSVPGMLPSISMYGPFTSPYRMYPPLTVTSLPSLPIFSMRLLNSMRWW